MNVKVETYEFNEGRFVLRAVCPYRLRVSVTCWHFVAGRTSAAVTDAIIDHVKHSHAELVDAEVTQ